VPPVAALAALSHFSCSRFVGAIFHLCVIWIQAHVSNVLKRYISRQRAMSISILELLQFAALLLAWWLLLVKHLNQLPNWMHMV